MIHISKHAMLSDNNSIVYCYLSFFSFPQKYTCNQQNVNIHLQRKKENEDLICGATAHIYNYNSIYNR